LETREEARIAAELTRFSQGNSDLESTLGEVVRLVVGLEQVLGPMLFKESLALHFSPARPQPDDSTDHPVIVQLVRDIERARGDGEVHREVDAFYTATFFLLGIYGVLTTTDDPGTREAMLAELVATALRGLEAR
jgi:TetR/AcrR family transcriptional repressor of uid operon